MSVKETGWTLRDGRKVISVRRSKQRLRGADIRGHQAKDLLAAMTEPAEGLRQSPQVKKPRELIESMRVAGEDRLTAHDQALYEQLLNTARHDGIEKEWHQISVGDIQSYLRVDHVDRVIEALDRIAGTLVTYDLGKDFARKHGKFPLAYYEVTEDLRAGTAVLDFSIPVQVRRLVLESDSYAKLEINAFPAFKSKYTARLYPRLAWRAGHDARLRKAWIIRPRELADELGYRYKIWNYRHFRRDCLDRVLDDITANVSRFSVRVDEVPGKGRGSPIESLVFQMSDISKNLWEVQASPMLRSQKHRLEAPDAAHQPAELPSASAVSRAMTMTGRSADELSNAWRSALDRAKAYNGGGPDAAGAQEAGLLYPLKHEGADAAFAAWVATLRGNARLNTARTHLPPAPFFRRQRIPPPPLAMAKPAAPIVVDDPFDYVDTMREAERDVLDDDCPF